MTSVVAYECPHKVAVEKDIHLRHVSIGASTAAYQLYFHFRVLPCHAEIESHIGVFIFIGPSTPCEKFDVAVPADTPSYMALANLCGLPALSLPMGFDGAGMPLGLQVMAAPFRDPLVLRAGKGFSVCYAAISSQINDY